MTSDRFKLRTESKAEQHVLGAVLLADINGDATCANKVFGPLSAADFCDPLHRSIYSAMGRLHDRGVPIEPKLLVAELDGEANEAAGILVKAGQSVVTTATVEHYVDLIATASKQRQTIMAANDALNAAREARTTGDLADIWAVLRSALTDIERGSTGKAQIVRIDTVEPQQVEWLWRDRIALGKVTLLVGDPGLGKSLLTLDITGRVSRGAPWPDNRSEQQPAGGVVLLSAEDDIADTIRPRLDAHEADCSRIVALTSLSDLFRDIDQLAAAIDATEDCRLVVVDPVSAYMGRVDSHNNAEVRAVLAPLGQLAAEKRVAILAVTHLRKGEGAAIYRAMGSLAFIAAARAAWVVCRDRNDQRRRLLLPIKNNLASDTASGLAFQVEPHGRDGAPVICWEPEPLSITADEAMAPERRKRGPAADERDEAAEWLRDRLSAGPVPAGEIIDEANGAGFNERTLQRAFHDINGKREKRGFSEGWLWRLPEGDTEGDKSSTVEKPVAFEETCRLRENSEENGIHEGTQNHEGAEGDKFRETGKNLSPWAEVDAATPSRLPGLCTGRLGATPAADQKP